MRRPAKKIFYGWWIVVAGTIINSLNGGIYFYGFSNFFMALVKEFGWSRAAISLGSSLARLEGAFEAPLVGFLIDRVGPRRIMLFGIGLMGIGFILFSKINSFGMYLTVFLTCLALGQGFGVYMPVHTTAANWFIKKRSQAMGILQAGVGFGGVLVPLFALIITQFGWRTGAVISGITILVIGLPCAGLFRHRPEPYGYLPDGRIEQTSGTADPLSSSETIKDPAAVGTDYSPKEAVKTMAFWSMVTAFGITQGVSGSVVLHSIPHFTDVGIPMVVAATATGSIGMASILGRLSFGFLGDRFSKRHLLALAIALEAAGVLIFSNLDSTWQIIPFLVVFCLGYGGIQPLILAVLADFFGRKSYGTVFGLQLFFRSLPQFGLPILAGWIFDVSGSYHAAFMLFIALLAVAGGLMLITRSPSKASLFPMGSIHLG
ncbi:MFS transporter [Chloroflexota bacterium]